MPFAQPLSCLLSLQECMLHSYSSCNPYLMLKFPLDSPIPHADLPLETSRNVWYFNIKYRLEYAFLPLYTFTYPSFSLAFTPYWSTQV